MDDDHDGDFNEKCFQIACQNQELAILKLLVQKVSPNEKAKTDVEMNLLNEPKWREWLFGIENQFLTHIIAQDTELAAYLKKLYRNEYGTDYQIPGNSDSSTLGKSSDKLQDSKALYELQTQEGNLQLNLNLNVTLQLINNLELTLLNHRSTISKDWNLYSKMLHEFILRLRDVNSIYQFIEKCPKFNDELINFLSTTDLRASNIKAEDVNIKLDDDNHSSPLHLAAEEGLSELVKVLLSKGADIEAKDDWQETALHKAAMEGHEEVTRLLIQNKAEVNAKNKSDWTPLHIASFGREKIVEILLQNSANPNSRTNSQETPLHKAVEFGHLKVVEVLLNHGADRTLKNNRNRTPWQGAQYYKRGNYHSTRL